MRQILLGAMLLFAAGCVGPNPKVDLQGLEAQVRIVETAFAQTMADRDFTAFESFLAHDAIFFAGERPLRGRAAVAAAWKPLFDGAAAPFSWSPATVAVQDGGELALSSGPVFDPGGAQVGVFNSIWRRTGDGTWQIIFDKGGSYCPEQAPQS